MSQGFTQALPNPLPISRGGTGNTGANSAPQLLGVTNASNATAGYVGEYVESIILDAGPVSITTTANLTSISLTAGDWDVSGNVQVNFSATGIHLYAWVSSTSNTLPNGAYYNGWYCTGTNNMALNGMQAPTRRFSLSSTTTIYVSASVSMVSGTANIIGGIYARRVR